jgi:hypothetical protein
VSNSLTPLPLNYLLQLLHESDGGPSFPQQSQDSRPDGTQCGTGAARAKFFESIVYY